MHENKIKSTCLSVFCSDGNFAPSLKKKYFKAIQDSLTDNTSLCKV